MHMYIVYVQTYIHIWRLVKVVSSELWGFRSPIAQLPLAQQNQNRLSSDLKMLESNCFIPITNDVPPNNRRA